MKVHEAFAFQGKACASLGSPFMGRLMPLIGERLSRGAVADRVLGWEGDPSPYGDSVPLRLAGALHALKIEGLALGEVYPPVDVPNDALWSAVEAALVEHEARVLHWLDSAPQTNEVRRSAVLIPALAMVAREFPGKPVELLELGCSAGLNLRCDRFRLDLPGGGIGAEGSPVRLAPKWRGAPIPGDLPDVVARRGIDLNPLDPVRDRVRLLAYLWPDQDDRIARTEAAIAVAREVPAGIEAGDAGVWAGRVLSEPAPDRVRVVYHTIAWQYFPETTKARALEAMKTTSSPIVRVAMEADGGDGARLSLTHYPTGEERELGRADFHGRWVDWQG